MYGGDGDITEAGAPRVTRRQVLGTAGGSLGLTLGGTSPPADGLGSSGGEHRQLAPVGETPRRSPYPADPFIVTQNGQQLVVPPDLGWGGWTPAESTNQALRTLLRFHPDVLDFAALARFEDGTPPLHTYIERELEMADLSGLPSTAGWNPSLQLGDGASRSAYGPVMEANSWTYPDGSPVDHPSGIMARTFDGEVATVSYGEDYGIPSPFAPGTIDLMAAAAIGRFEQGFSGFFLDGVNFFHLRGLDYSVWAQAAFREHLASLPVARLDELGIQDPGSFDVREYFAARDLEPGTDADPRTDPVFREYLLFQHRGLRDMFDAFRERTLDGLPEGVTEAATAIWGNQFLGTLSTPVGPTVYASDAFDVINTEQTQPFFDYGYKILHSLARFEKPVLAETELTAPPGDPDHPLAAFDPRRNYPNLQRFMLGEGYAMGAVPRVSLTGRAPADLTLNHWVRKDGTVPAELGSFIDFVWAHRRFLTDVELANPVAVVLSLPDLLWRRHGRGIDGFQGGAGASSFLGTTRLLREAQIPYDVLTFGHRDLWDDPDQRDRLMSYAAVVLPSLLCVSDPQLQALRDYLDAGGTLVSSGPPPGRSETFEPREDVREVIDHENATVLGEDPGRRRHEAGVRVGSLVGTLEENGVRSMVAGEEPDVGVNRLSQPDRSRTVLHVLNYDYDPGADAFSSKRDLTLRLPAPDIAVGVARYYTARGIADLEVIEGEDAVEVALPELVDWGFVVFTPSTAALEPPTTEQSAREAVGRARDAVDRARDEGRDDGPGFVVADVALQAAETALSYGAYEQARAAASRAGESVRTERPSGRLDGTASEAPGFTLSTGLLAGVILAIAGWILHRGDDRDP